MTAAPSVGRFVLRAFLWLPPCFAAWYFAARPLATLGGGLAGIVANLFKPDIVSAVERQGPDLVFVTTVHAQAAAGQAAVLLVEVNPLLYSYGLPFFLALMLAARSNAWKMLAGAAALVPFQAWGIAFDFLAQLAVRAGPAVAAQAGLLGWRAEAIALAYQLGSLIFPALVPVVLWAAFNRPFLQRELSSRNDEGSSSASMRSSQRSAASSTMSSTCSNPSTPP